MTGYLMESAREGARLLAQGKASPATERLVAAGLQPGMHALDAGCGAGAVIPEMLALVGGEGRVTGIDASAARLADARRALGDDGRIELLERALPATGLPAARYDFAWSQFVLEYYADPLPALRELARVTKPGGRVAIAEIDRVGLDFWPVPPAVAEGQATFVAAVARTGYDVECGRKMFHHLKRLGFADVRVHASMHYLAAGAADERLLEDWRIRFDALRPAVAPAFGAPENYERFCGAYLDMLADGDTLKYVLVLTTSGTRQ